MTYEEFLKGVDELGFKVGNHFENLKITNVKNETVAYVHKENVGEVDTFHYGFKSLETSEKLKLLDLCVELAKTPLEERESKKYFLKHKFIFDKQAYLAKNEKYFWLMIKIRTDADYQQFTLDEIEGIKEKFGVTLEDWELVEVEE